MDLTPKAKHMLVTQCIHDFFPTQGPRDAIDITAARRSSLLLEPITGSHLEGQGDGETLDQLRGKPIPPITSSKSVDTANDATSEQDKTGSEK